MITYNKLIKKTLSFLLVFMILIPNLTNTVLFSEETSKYPYTLFGRNGITISTLSNLSINGNIHTNKEASVSSQNKNVNGRITTGNDIEKRVKHVYADKKIYQNYFTQNCEFYESEYVRSELNININNPVFSYGNIIFNGNVSLNSNIGTYMDINITGEVKNANNSVVYSKYGDITIENNSTANINGLIYAPLGTLTINAPNINLGGIIIADEVIINGSNVNINCNDNIARFIGTTSEAYDFSGLECLPEEWLGDTDLDDLFDIYEKVIDTDPLNPDTDFDELPDGYEVLTLNTDPLEVDTDLNGIWDKDEDFDSDNLSNLGEYQNKTEPFIPDSDEDGLLDGDEVHTYGTDPLNPDTDADKLLDGEEGYSGTIFTKYGVYFDPLMPDTDGNGILDGDEIFGQSKQQQVQTHDGAIVGVYVNMNTNGNLDKNLSIKNVYNIDMLSSNVVGLVGDPFDINTTTSFNRAIISFEIDQTKLGDTAFTDLIFLWHDEENHIFRELETAYDGINSTVSTTVNHFSKYMIVDKKKWFAAWNTELNYYSDSHAVITCGTVLAIDCSESMKENDPPFKLYLNIPGTPSSIYRTTTYRELAAEGFIGALDSNDEAATIKFTTTAKWLCHLTTDKNDLITSLTSINANGGTNYNPVLRTAIDELKSATLTRKYIILLSDGKPGYRLDDLLLDEAKAAHIKIYTIGLGIDSTGKSVLEYIANYTGAQYFEVTTSSKLIETYSKIGTTKDIDMTDSDHDGLPDIFETTGMKLENGEIIYTDPQNPDSDGDGMDDGEEINPKYRYMTGAPSDIQYSTKSIYFVRNFCDDDYFDVTKHNFSGFNGDYLVCADCGYKVLSPVMQDKDILLEDDYLRVQTLYAEFSKIFTKSPEMSLIEASKKYNNSIYIIEIEKIRSKEQYRNKYEYADGDYNYYSDVLESVNIDNIYYTKDANGKLIATNHCDCWVETVDESNKINYDYVYVAAPLICNVFTTGISISHPYIGCILSAALSVTDGTMTVDEAGTNGFYTVLGVLPKSKGFDMALAVTSLIQTSNSTFSNENNLKPQYGDKFVYINKGWKCECGSRTCNFPAYTSVATYWYRDGLINYYSFTG